MIETLTVKEALAEDAGMNKVRLSPDILKKMNLSPGDIISLRGKRSSCGMVFTDHSSRGKRYIRLNKEARRNCMVNLGERIEIERAETSPCIRCKLVPLVGSEKGGIILSLHIEDFIRDKLLRQPLSQNDTVMITGIAIAGGGIPFQVLRTEPEGIVRVTEDTSFTLELPPEKGDENVHRSKVSYEDIGGLTPELANIREMVELPLKMPHLFGTMGIAPPKGLLLHGPPGTGKTLITQALAHEIGAGIFSIKGPEIMDSLYGKSEKNLRDVFKKARTDPPSIIFIDEIDSIAPKRNVTSGDVEKRVVAQLLTLMDSLPEDGQIMVIGTTNRPDALEDALRRPGRFDREVELSPPDEHGREEILAIHSRGMPLTENVDLKAICDMTVGYVGADIQALCREAALSAIKKHISKEGGTLDIASEGITNITVSMSDFHNGLKKIMPTALREITVEIPMCTFEDIGGLEAVKRDLRECVEKPFTHKSDFNRLGIKTPNGILLFGPPGTGKTLLARAIASEVKASFISIKGPEILSRFVGEAEKSLRKIFKKARQVAPCIIFFDEIDSIARGRGSTAEDRHGSENLTNQLLTLINGIEQYEDVIVIGATNRPELIDTAFMRKGRFDRLIFVPPPDIEGRKQIFAIHTRDIPVSPEVNIPYLVERTEGFSGADMEGLAQEAAIEAFREDPKAEEVCQKHFLNALKRLKPSINKETIKYYNTINKRLTGRVTTGDGDDTPLGYG